MSKHSDAFNALPFEQRELLVPVMQETRIRDLKAMREQLVTNHKKQLRDWDELISRLESAVGDKQEQL